MEGHECEVIEYIYGLNRAYSTEQGYGSELIYTDAYGQDVAMGHRINTEGVAFRLHPEIVEQTTSQFLRGAENGNASWGPSIIRALSAFLKADSIRSGMALSKFEIEDVIAILLRPWADSSVPLSLDFIQIRLEK